MKRTRKMKRRKTPEMIQHRDGSRSYPAYTRFNPLHVLVQRNGTMVIAKGHSKGSRVSWGLISDLFNRGGVKFKHEK